VTSRILVSLRVKASPERAFAAFTQEIGAWWKPNDLFQFTPRSPGVLSFENGARLIETLPGGKVFEIGKVTAWEPPHRLTFGWRQATFAADQHTQVEVRFEPVGEETRISVTHSGWDSVPAAHVARHSIPDALFLRRHGEWWQALLACLGETLT
jgi:uncharacterized protein YndB with AHSA1/START domain